MKKIIIGILVFLCLVGTSVSAQNKLFETHTDSAKLVDNANLLIKQFIVDVNKIKPDLKLKTTGVLNTKPFLIFYNSRQDVVNLPLWSQVIAPQKDFFYKLAGSENEGVKVFGLLFNGFYLAHELGHAAQTSAQKTIADKYDNEYFANVVAVLYWKKIGKRKELDACYKYAKIILKQLSNPVPTGEDERTYFTANYAKLSVDPYKYGYFQFSQLVKIYEDKTLPDFDTFIKEKM
ncbi:MAG: hypothetical protein REI64_14045 [Pedobacter sp.]|uniref:hypothetical protein n=1 Tax=Pedobacter sp. TaxID=1411316 RepID=UPI002807EA19|nr:hypothetical protein [Pedobacter sp.]MDQ8005920.1 hypothetical protein [Pedobacter sp.]